MKKALEIILCAIFVGCALAFGGVQPLAYSLTEVFLFLTVLALLWNEKRHGDIDLSLPIWPFLFALVVVLQVVPLPRGLVAEAGSLHRMALSWTESLGGTQAWATLSIYRHATLLALVKILAYLSAFILAVHLFDSGKRKSNIVRTLVILGCLEAVYGIIQYLLSWNKIYTFTNTYDMWVATGTYINRNHFAGMLELTLPFAFALAFYSYQLWLDYRQGRIPPRPAGNENPEGFQVVFYLFLLLIMVLGVLFSKSRGGILAVTLTLIVLSILTLLKVRRKAWALGVLGFLTLVAGFGLWIGLGPVLSRFEGMRQANALNNSERILIWKDTLQVLRGHPIVGTGLGTFEESFRPYQTALVNNNIDHAHNDYLEFISETGLLGAGLLFLPIFYLLVRMVIAFLDDPRRYRRAVILGCIGSTLGLLIHSNTDFNLQLPANAVIFAVILGIGYKAACVEPAKEARKRAAAIQ